MKTKCKFNQGFATISLMLFLPLLCLMVFSFGFSGYLIQHKTKIRSTCLTEGRKIQENLVRNEESVLKLNSVASALRLRLNLAYLELAEAEASGNAAWITRALAKIAAIEKQQKQLDSLQKFLIKKAKLEVSIRVASMQNQLNGIDHDTQKIWRFYLNIFAISMVTHVPEVALVRDSPDVAPVYELAKDHQSKQSLAFRWQTIFQTKASAQKLLDSENEVGFLCRVSAKKEGTKWNLLINADKS